MTIKRREMIALTFLVPIQGAPGAIKLRECSMPYVHEAPSKGLITGVYGSVSKQQALVASSAWLVQHQGRAGAPDRFLFVDLNYAVPNLDMTRNNSSDETLDKTGWIHIDRITTAYRQELKAMFVEWLRQEYSNPQVTRIEQKTLAEIALLYPQCITRLFAEDRRIKVVIHPVRPAIDESMVLWAATVRYDPVHFADVQVRFMPQVRIRLD